MKYNYVIIQGNTDYYRLMTERTVASNEAIVVTGLFDVKNTFLKKVLNRMLDICMSRRMYGLVKLLFPFAFRRKSPNGKPFCFLIMGWYANVVHAGLGKHLRKKYPGCKLVCRFEDIIEKMPYRNIEEYRGDFDFLQSFDSRDARKHGIDFFPSWYDKCLALENWHGDILYDVCFVGKGKDRLEEVFAAYEKLNSSGAKCFFYLVDVPLEERRFPEGIMYGGCLPYIEVLTILLQSNAVLEIIQHESESETLRVFEALTYKRKLITNNTQIATKKYFSSKIINVYNKPSEINVDFVKSFPKEEDFNETYANQLRPINMLSVLDTKLKNLERGK